MSVQLVAQGTQIIFFHACNTVKTNTFLPLSIIPTILSYAHRLTRQRNFPASVIKLCHLQLSVIDSPTLDGLHS